MNFNLYIVVTDVMEQSKADVVYHLSQHLNTYFQSKDYSPEVETMEIGLLMTATRKGYEDWYIPRRITYTGYRLNIHKFTGEQTEIVKTLRYEIKLGDEQLALYTSGSDEVSIRLLTEELLSSLWNFDRLPRGITEFDVERFKIDMTSVLNHILAGGYA